MAYNPKNQIITYKIKNNIIIKFKVLSILIYTIEIDNTLNLIQEFRETK